MDNVAKYGRRTLALEEEETGVKPGKADPVVVCEGVVPEVLDEEDAGFEEAFVGTAAGRAVAVVPACTKILLTVSVATSVPPAVEQTARSPEREHPTPMVTPRLL